MAGNMGCFVAGCENPVIGQCPGYELTCGKFYCRIHSVENLCLECGRRKVSDDIMQDYLQTARKIEEIGPGPSAKKRKYLSIGFSVYTLLFMLGLCSGTTPKSSEMSGAVFVVAIWIFLLIALISAVRNYKGEDSKEERIAKAITDTDKVKSGFRKFYEKYKKVESEANRERSRQLLREMLADLPMVMAQGVGKGFEDALRHSSAGPSVDRLDHIQHSLDDIKKRLS